MATPTVTVRRGDYQYAGGGEFAATIGIGTTGLPSGYEFQTFCVERSEELGYGTPYYFEVNTAAVLGSEGSGYDPLDPRTAYLYNEFLNETLVGYNFNGTAAQRKTDAGRLQNTIWHIEQEKDDLGNTVVADPTFLADATTNHTGSIGDIRVLNLWQYSNMTGRVQDVLVRTTPPAVPAPGALLLSAMGTMGVGYFRRRRTV